MNANVRVYLGGQVFRAPLDTPLPTNPTAVLDTAFENLGILTDDGITDDPGRGAKNILALGGQNVRTFVETEEPTVKITCLEENAVLQSIVNPGGTPVTDAGITTTTRARWEPNPGVFVVKGKDGDIHDLYAFTGEVAEVGPRVKKADAATRELTIAIYPDDDGNYGTDITDDPAQVAATGS
jgi:hypothetical protein